MKIALISDIHSNLFYLEKILGLIRQEKVDQIYCLGDLIGYYDCPHEVLQACRAHNVRMVRGNHEHYVLGSLPYNREREDLYRIQKQKEHLTSADMELLESLPDFIDINIMGKRLYLTHSLPGNCVEYIHTSAELNTDFISGYDYFCFGHTHRPLINCHFGCCIVNPGSIGQPRDYSRKPSYIVIDLAKDSTTLVKADVDHSTYIRRLREKGYGESTLNVLERSFT